MEAGPNVQCLCKLTTHDNNTTILTMKKKVCHGHTRYKELENNLKDEQVAGSDVSRVYRS